MKRNFLVLIFFVACNRLGFAQCPCLESKEHRFSIEVEGGLTRIFFTPNHFSLSESDKQVLVSTEKIDAMPSRDFKSEPLGIRGSFALNQHFQIILSAIIQSSELNASGELDGYSFYGQFNGLNFSSQPTYMSEYESFSAVSFPVMVEYDFGSMKFKPFASLGVAPLFVYQKDASTSLWFQEPAVFADDGMIASKNISAIVATGIKYCAGQHYSFSIEPQLSYYFITQSILNENYKPHQMQMGALAVIQYRL